MIIILSLLLNDVLEVVIIEDITGVHILLLLLFLLCWHLPPKALPLTVLLASCSDEKGAR